MNRLRAIRAVARNVLDAFHGLLAGEPLRALIYGGGFIAFLVANAFDRIPDMTFEEAVINATAASVVLVALTEKARSLVYSQNTVNDIIDSLSE